MNFNVNININGAGTGVAVAAACQKGKKAKVDNDKPKAPARTTAATGKKQTARRTGGAPGSSQLNAQATPRPPSAPNAKAEPKPKAPPKPKATPKAKSEHKVKAESPVITGPMYSQPPHPASSPSKPKLGLLNGAYEVIFSNGRSGEIILCMQGNGIWGSFQAFDENTHGVFYLPQRPWGASLDPNDSHSFGWRGVDDNGDTVMGDSCRGWIYFLGDGEISGTICDLDPQGYDYEFRGSRTSGSQTSAPRTARSMQDEFEDYEFKDCEY